MIYTSVHFWDGWLDGPADFASNALWLPFYDDLSTIPAAPAAWQGLHFWQYASDRILPATSTLVDFDIFNGGEDAMAAFVEGSILTI
jgi:GH25 family lysozyme M1 (1,4-beta-N-acetylmuramidase)